jgi:hypothetical protein
MRIDGNGWECPNSLFLPVQITNQLNQFHKLLQKREYCLRTRSKVLTEHETIKELQLRLKARESNKQQQLCYRLNMSSEKMIASINF